MPDVVDHLVHDLRGTTAEHDEALKANDTPSSGLSIMLLRFRCEPETRRSEVYSRLDDDALALRILSFLVLYESSSQLRIEVINRLVMIGLPALDMLIQLTDDPAVEVCIAAIEGLGQVMITSYPHLAEKGPFGRFPYAPRVRGYRADYSVTPDVDKVLSLLDKLRCREWSEDCRKAADDTLALLDA